MCNEPSPSSLSRARRNIPPESPTRPPLPQTGPEQLIGYDPPSLFPFSSVFSPATTPTVATPAPSTNNNGPWTCQHCTVKNPTYTASCSTCNSPNPNYRTPSTSTGIAPSTGINPSMGRGGMGGFRSLFPDQAQWACQYCGTFNIQGLIKCSSCQSPNVQMFLQPQGGPQGQCIIS